MPYVYTQGIRLYYEQQGSGIPPLVFVHRYYSDGRLSGTGNWQACLGYVQHPAVSFHAALNRGRGPSVTNIFYPICYFILSNERES